jgi:hypothetical protein
VIPLHWARRPSDDPPALSLKRLSAAVRELEALRQCLAKVAIDCPWSAQEWAANCTPLMLRLHFARPSLADLTMIRVGTWPDTGWAVRLRAAHDEVERRMAEVSASAASLMSTETSSVDAVVNLNVEGSKLADALDGLRGLVVAAYPAAGEDT